MSISTLSPADAFAVRGKQPVRLVDVRTPAEFRAVHAEGAILISLDRFDPAILPGGAGGGPIHLICGSGTRAATAAEKLRAAGFEDVAVIEGGTAAWAAAGLPVRRGRKAISLERQVRIAAGSLVVIGIVLGWFVHRYVFGLSAFVGAGLVFAGITDTCGLGLILGRAPWNNVALEPEAGPAECANQA